MLTVHIPEIEMFDEQKQEFVTIKEQNLSLEHSLVSISKWESKWCKPFLHYSEKTREMTLDYIRCMTLTQNVKPIIYEYLPDNVISEVTEYINLPMTATWFSETSSKPNREIITSELIYYWMITFNIPVEFQKWHLNRLMTLIRVCSEKNSPKKKMSKDDIRKQNAALNAERRAKFNSTG